MLDVAFTAKLPPKDDFIKWNREKFHILGEQLRLRFEDAGCVDNSHPILIAAVQKLVEAKDLFSQAYIHQKKV